MLPIVNPYRDGQLAGVDKHKPKKAPAAGLCSTRTTFLAVLICIVCGTYFLHLNYFASVNKKPSMRGGNTYRSFSDSVKDFAAEVHQDLKKLDDQKRSGNETPPDDRKPPDVPRSGKVVTFGSNNKLEAKKLPIPVAPVSNEVLPKPGPASLNQLSPELINRIQLERDAARGVEAKIANLAEHVKMLSELPKPKREPPPPPLEEGETVTQTDGAEPPATPGVAGEAEEEPIPETIVDRGAEREKPLQPPASAEEKQEQQQVPVVVEEPAVRAPTEEHGIAEQPPAGEQVEVPNAENKIQEDGGALQAMVADRLAGEEQLAPAEADISEPRVADEIRPAEVPDRPEEQPALPEGGALQALVAARPTNPEPVPPNPYLVPQGLPNVTVSQKDLLHELDKAHLDRASGDAVPEKVEHLDSPRDAAERAAADARGEGQGQAAAAPIADPREDPLSAAQAGAQAEPQVPERPEMPAVGEGDGVAADGAVAQLEHPDSPVEVAAVVGIPHRLDPPPAAAQEPQGEAGSKPDADEQQQEPNAAAAAVDSNPVEHPIPPVVVTTTANNRPTGYDLPDVQEAPRADAADGRGEGGDKPKIDYCAGQVDPFAAVPVDSFVPPKEADFELVQQWRSAVRAMLSKVGKVRYGGDELRQLIRAEVDALQVMRFKMFCQYA